MKIQQLETICEAIQNEANEICETLKDNRINKNEMQKKIDNICLYNEEIYAIFENCNGLEEEKQELEKENEQLKSLIFELAGDDLQLLMDLKLKYNL